MTMKLSLLLVLLVGLCFHTNDALQSPPWPRSTGTTPPTKSSSSSSSSSSSLGITAAIGDCRQVVASFFLAGSISLGGGGFLDNNVAMAAETSTLTSSSSSTTTTIIADATAAVPTEADVSDFQRQVQQSLKQPTEDQPQIPFPTTASFPSKKKSSSSSSSSVPPPTQLQSLISLANPQTMRPIASDTLIIQIFETDEAARMSPSSTTTTSNSLGGAKIPISKLKFPTRIQMGSRNGIIRNANNNNDWDTILSTQDVYIKATVCPSEGPIPCPNPYLQGIAISKLVVIPTTTTTSAAGSDGDNDTVGGTDNNNNNKSSSLLRLPASVVLGAPTSR